MAFDAQANNEHLTIMLAYDANWWILKQQIIICMDAMVTWNFYKLANELNKLTLAWVSQIAYKTKETVRVSRIPGDSATSRNNHRSKVPA